MSGPFDGSLDAVLPQRVGDGKCDGLREEKLFGSLQEGRFQDETEGEVLARDALPAVAALSPACGLAHGDDRIAVAVAVAVGGLGVGRAALRQYRCFSPEHVVICGKEVRRNGGRHS